jgi:hypothetical protein
MTYYERALKSASPRQRGSIYLRMARLLAANKNWCEVCRVLNEAIACGEDSENINFELALAYLNLGQREHAQQQMQILKVMGSHLAARLRQIMAL